MSHTGWDHPYFDRALPFIEEWKSKNPHWKDWQKEPKCTLQVGVRFVTPELADRHRRTGHYVPITDESVIKFIRETWIDDEPGFAPSDENTVLVVMEVPR